MKPFVQNKQVVRRLPFRDLSVALLTASIFILDVLLPLSFDEAILYVVPLVLYSVGKREKQVWGAVVVLILLLSLGFLLSSWDVSLASAVTKRLMAIGTLCILAPILIERNSARAVRSAYEEELQRQVDERTRRIGEQSRELVAGMERLRLAQEAAKAGSWEWDFETGQGFWSEELWRLFGLEARDRSASYEEWLQIVHPEDREPVLQRFREAGAKRDEINAEYRVVDRDGSVRWLMVRGRPLRNGEGKDKHYVGIVMDVTQPKRMEEELRQSRDELERRVRDRTHEVLMAYEKLQAEVEEHNRTEHERLKLATAVEQAAEGVFITDTEGKLEYVNQSMCRMLGYRKEELLGQYVWITRPDEAGQALAQGIRDTVNAGQVWAGRITRKRKDGRLLETETTVGPIKNASGVIISQVALTRDITAQLELEEQLQQARKMQAIGQLAGGIAHDFNNILATIMGNAELAADEVGEGSRARDNLEQILKATHRARDLVREILAFSRKSAKEKKPVQLTPIIRETFNLLRASLPATITMSLRTTATEDTVVGDAGQVQQILMNLAVNAAQAMPEGGRLDIALVDTRFDSPQVLSDGLLVPGDYIELSVRDTGVGMDEATRRRIFEPFFTTKEAGRGTGLGLAVVYGIVKSYQGMITVSSAPGRGSNFRVFLPKAQGRVEAVREKQRILPRGSETVLLVDDEEAIRLMAQATLSRLGYTVVSEGDPRQALRRFHQNPGAFDVIITDQTMPEMTGIALSRAILQVRQGTPIILFTGYSDAVDEQTAKAAGIREFIMKPLTKQDLANVVRRALDRAA